MFMSEQIIFENSTRIKSESNASHSIHSYSSPLDSILQNWREKILNRGLLCIELIIFDSITIDTIDRSIPGGHAEVNETNTSVASGTSVAQLRVSRIRPMDVARDGRILSGPVEVQQGFLCDLARRGWQVRETMRAILLSVEEALPGRIQQTSCSPR